VRFGLALPHYDFSLPGDGAIGWHAVRDWAVRAEALGFDSVWVSDHVPSLVSWRRDKLCGTPEAMAGTVAAFGALGVEEVILSFGLVPFQVADPSAPELFATEVAPQLRSTG
jgi:hypothetical protein